MALHLPRKHIPLHALKLSLDDVIKIFERLLGHVDEQANIEISKFKKPDDKSDEEFQNENANIRALAFRVTITITGDGGASPSATMFHSFYLRTNQTA